MFPEVCVAKHYVRMKAQISVEVFTLSGFKDTLSALYT
jgi:hypothetical protein